MELRLGTSRFIMIPPQMWIAMLQYHLPLLAARPAHHVNVLSVVHWVWRVIVVVISELSNCMFCLYSVSHGFDCACLPHTNNP